MFWMQLRRGQLDAFDRRTPVILPTAAVEQHGEYLPLGTDCMIVGAIANAVARDGVLDERGFSESAQDFFLVVSCQLFFGASHPPDTWNVKRGT